MNWLSYKIGIRKLKEVNKKRSQERSKIDGIFSLGKHLQFGKSKQNWFMNGDVPLYENVSLSNPTEIEASNLTFKRIPLNHLRKTNEESAILSQINFICGKLKSADEEDLIHTEWRTVAMTIDKIVFMMVVTMCGLTLLAVIFCVPGYVK